MRKTSKRLADGREIIYYDGPAAPPRLAEDRRHLRALDAKCELRFDPLLGEWVMFASHRQDRSFMPAAKDCPLCPTTPGHATEVPESHYEVVVFENRFPALFSPYALVPPEPRYEPSDLPGSPELLAARPSAGRCEVVCYTDDHHASFAELSPQRVDLVLAALTDRTSELGARPDVEQVFCFENRGAEIGVTQPHPHGQIYAYPFITPRTQTMLASAREYRERQGRNLFDDVLAAERSAAERVLIDTGNWTAFVPHASRWPYAVHCYPNERVPDLAALPGPARAELPTVLLDIFGRFTRLFDAPAPYIAAWHQAPVSQRRGDFALHLEIFTVRRANDRLKYLAASESGMDAFANDIMPETAARRLRELGR